MKYYDNIISPTPRTVTHTHKKRRNVPRVSWSSSREVMSEAKGLGFKFSVARRSNLYLFIHQKKESGDVR